MQLALSVFFLMDRGAFFVSTKSTEVELKCTKENVQNFPSGDFKIKIGCKTLASTCSIPTGSITWMLFCSFL